MLKRCVTSARKNVGRARALFALPNLELDLLILVERRVPLRPDLRVMHEEVLTAIVRDDEPKSFARIKPFHCTFCHVIFS